MLEATTSDNCQDDNNNNLGLIQLRALSLVEKARSFDLAPATGGLLAEFFYLTTNYLGQLADVGFSSGKQPDVTRIDPNINYPSTGTAWEGLDRVDHFAARWTGSLRIDEAGTYTFKTRSDDGSQLRLNGVQVVDNDGLHSMRDSFGTADLTSGDHKLEVTFFENNGGGGIIVSYSGPDTGDEMEIIPSGALVPEAGVEEEEPLTPPAEGCPDECKSPTCVAGDFASGGWLLDDGVCTVTCSEPDAVGTRQCGRGAAFENSDDSIDCSKCVKVEEQCGQCVLWGDPHIVPFDRAVRMQNGRGSNVDMYNYGDYWIVKSSDVYIQGRYWSSKYRGNSMTRGLAIGGPFLKGNLLMIEPLDGTVEWNGGEVVTSFPSTFSVPGLLYMKYHDRAEVVRTGGLHPSIKGLDIMLPLGVRLTVNRFSGHLDILITMHTLPGGIDGHCGNCNHDESDDTRQQITERFGDPCDPKEDLFTVKEYSPVGCYAEDVGDRDLTVKKDINMNDEECAMACIDYKWFGIQGNGECWCGDEYGKHGEATGCNCPHEGAGGAVGTDKQCIYGYFDSEQPPEQDVDKDCEPELKAKAEELCGNAFGGEEVDDPNMKELCMSDVCFGSEEFAEEDAWAAHETLPCASVADVQGVCGKKVGKCTQGSANCDMSDCAEYQALGWFAREVKLLSDGQALGTGHLTNIVAFENRDGVCITDKGTLEACSNAECMRKVGPGATTTTTTECVGKDCTFWGDPHVHSFDQMSFSDTQEGDMWLVKSKDVFIQGRFGIAKNSKHSFLKAVAVGGPFLEGNTLTLGTLDGDVLWNKHHVLSKLGADFHTLVNGKPVHASFREAVPNVNDPHHTTHGIDVVLPNGIHLTIDRFPTWLGLRIRQLHELEGGQDGVCGNFNNVTNDDSLKALALRMDARVSHTDSLFHMDYTTWRAKHAVLLGLSE